MIRQMTIATALPGFNDLGRPKTDFINNYLHSVQK